VGVALAVEGVLELLVRSIERAVVPVEAAAAFGGAHEERHKDAAVERSRLVGRVALVCAREDPRGGFALEIGDRLAHIVALEKPLGVRLDEAAYERAILVERRAAVRPVLLEGERQVRAVERRERPQAEPAQRVVEMRGAHKLPSPPSAARLLYG